jgi:hypothetical protein
VKIGWPRAELNQRHKDFQSSALPTELLGLARSTERLRLTCDSLLRMMLTHSNEGRDYTEVGSPIDAPRTR